MEDILASIRKMISDDRAGPRPFPDPMTRTPFSDVSSPASAEPAYGSLSEAIKAAGQPADQRRTLEERISYLLDKGSVVSVDPLSSLANRASTVSPAAPSRPAARAEPTLRGSQELPAHRSSPGTAGPAAPLGHA
jgi:cell pole-organizing protein PopZ